MKPQKPTVGGNKPQATIAAAAPAAQPGSARAGAAVRQGTPRPQCCRHLSAAVDRMQPAGQPAVRTSLNGQAIIAITVRTKNGPESRAGRGSAAAPSQPQRRDAVWENPHFIPRPAPRKAGSCPAATGRTRRCNRALASTIGFPLRAMRESRPAFAWRTCPHHKTRQTIDPPYPPTQDVARASQNRPSAPGPRYRRFRPG